MQSVVWVLALAVVTQVWAEGCGPAERLRVKSDWADAYKTGVARLEFGTRVFDRFLKRAPDARKLFDRVHGDNTLSPEFQAHVSRVFGGLDMVISLLLDKPVLAQQIKHLNHQHQEMGIPDEYFVTIGEVIFETLPEFTEHLPNIPAWRACYDLFVRDVTAEA